MNSKDHHSTVDYFVHSRSNVIPSYVRSNYHENCSDHVLLYGEFTAVSRYAPQVQPVSGIYWKVGKLQQTEARERMAENFKDHHRPHLERSDTMCLYDTGGLRRNLRDTEESHHEKWRQGPWEEQRNASH